VSLEQLLAPLNVIMQK
jgi:hypothetical protein